MTRRLTGTILTTTAIAALLLGAGALQARRNGEAPVVVTEEITRGPVVSRISAMGTVQAVNTVEVGTQVTGTIQALYADFNSIVRKGQVLARLDPSLFESALEQARASLVRAEADRDRLSVALGDARVKHERAQELSARQLIPAMELDAAAMNVKSAEAQVRAAAAQVAQAQAAVGQAQVTLSKTVITAPIDGIVVSRNVDVGQTVAASLQAPTLFLLAGGLERMEVKASIDEADVGVVREGQSATFTVDAYPGERFTGTVEQVRLNPVVEQNVVTYAAILRAANPGLKLKPGLSAHITIEVARRDEVLRVPAAALRFRPTEDVKKALGADGLTAQGTTVWQHTADGLRPVSVTAGASDGVHTEIGGGGLVEGARVVTRVTTGTASAAAPRAASPLMPSGGGRASR
jgi:HlyD family secretion protein